MNSGTGVSRGAGELTGLGRLSGGGCRGVGCGGRSSGAALGIAPVSGGGGFGLGPGAAAATHVASPAAEALGRLAGAFAGRSSSPRSISSGSPSPSPRSISSGFAVPREACCVASARSQTSAVASSSASRSISSGLAATVPNPPTSPPPGSQLGNIPEVPNNTEAGSSPIRPSLYGMSSMAAKRWDCGL
eukprot:scaffold418_cov386-Prasinococcus_capsulatus_cf.AAC.15